ncbi:MAG: phosphotransferase [Deltaproteobacteria bacterium]|uniref:Phosphotransferase n=1 Tax=Candidatus Zymogenus saltonus TaxID=2844893 RepID=A0A9D8KD05_9DELT|nr:phosphotransferase [Candidatus Zymogenus saltonus]
MRGDKTDSLFDTADRFSLDGEIVNVVPHKVGHINDTYIVETKPASAGSGFIKYVLQRVNRRVFPEPKPLIDNIKRVTERIRERVKDRGGDPTREVLTLTDTKNGNHFHVDDLGEFWRCYLHIDGLTVDFVKSDESGIGMAYEASSAFGRFQEDLKDIDISKINVTIKDFHNTPLRFDSFLKSVKDDPHGRCEGVKDEIEFCLEREGLKGAITDILDSGDIPIRVTHNDTKINNVIFEGGMGSLPRALCVIDLDTVMPGSLLYDFGDQVRTTTSSSAEDEPDLEKIAFDLGLFEALVRGYLEACSGFITGEERRLLPVCGRVITFETGLRFLTDYLMGDKYFKIERAGQNLDRARTQFRLVSLMEELEREMEAVVRRY